MGFYKLRKWVGTVTGKGDRWGRDREGRSAPAFLAASTTALPPSTCTARREAGQVVCGCCCAARPANCWLCFLRPVPDGESAGCVRLQWLVLRAVCLLAFAMPCPLPSTFLPPSSLFCFAPVHSMCARIVTSCCIMFASCENCPVGSCNTGLQRRPVRRFLTFPASFPAESMILGHGCSVK